MVVEDGDLGCGEDEAVAQRSQAEGDIITPVREDLLQSARLALRLGKDVNVVALLVETADLLLEDGQLALDDTRRGGAEAHGGVHFAQRRRAQPPARIQSFLQPVAVAHQHCQRYMGAAIGVALPVTARGSEGLDQLGVEVVGLLAVEQGIFTQVGEQTVVDAIEDGHDRLDAVEHGRAQLELVFHLGKIDTRLLLGALQVGHVVVEEGAVQDDLARRQDDSLADAADGSLRGDVEGADRLDFVAEELQAHGVIEADRIDVENAAAGAELTDAVDDGHALEAGVRQVRDQSVEGTLLADLQVQCGAFESGHRHDGGQQRRRRGDDDRRFC